jgi:hypothetical protein
LVGVLEQAVEKLRRARWLITLVLIAALGLGVWLVVRPSRPTSPELLVGVDDDTIKWTPFPLTVVRRQRRLGVDAVRISVPWHGEAVPSAVRRVELLRAETAARQTAVVLSVFGFAAVTPVDARAQARFCSYAHAALALVPDARAVVVWNEANSPTYWRGTPAEYESLLARCYDELHTSHLVVLDSTASAHGPATFLDALAEAYRASGRRRPLMDAFGHNPYPLNIGEQPGVRHAGDFIGEGDYARLIATLRAGFAGTAQRSLAIWYLEDGFQAQIPVHLQHHYDGHETVAVVAADVQAEHVVSAIHLAACQPLVRAFFNFELVDERRLAGWQSGLIWRGGHEKPAAAAFATAARHVAAGTVDCRP